MNIVKNLTTNGVNFDRCVGSFNTLIDLSNKLCVPNKTEHLNLSIFNMITGINELKTLTKQTSCECKCRFDGRKYNSAEWWNNDKCKCECTKRHVCEKDYTWNLSTCNYENGKYLGSIMDNLTITCDETVVSYDKDKTKTIQTNFNEE